MSKQEKDLDTMVEIFTDLSNRFGYYTALYLLENRFWHASRSLKNNGKKVTAKQLGVKIRVTQRNTRHKRQYHRELAKIPREGQDV